MFERLPGGYVPQNNGVVAAASGQDLSIGAEINAVDIICVAQQGLTGHLAGGRIPDDDAVIHAGRGQLPPIPAESYRINAAGVPFQRRFEAAGAGIPQPQQAILAAGSQGLPIRAEGHPKNCSAMSL
jgi:hypothetical protein